MAAPSLRRRGQKGLRRPGSAEATRMYKPPCKGLIDSRRPLVAEINGRVVNTYRCPACGAERRHIGRIDRDDWAPVKRCYSKYFKESAGSKHVLGARRC